MREWKGWGDKMMEERRRRKRKKRREGVMIAGIRQYAVVN